MTETVSRDKERSSSAPAQHLARHKSVTRYKDGRPDVVSSASYDATLSSFKERVSYEVHEGPPYKTGGPFKLRRYRLTRQPCPVSLKGSWDYGSNVNTRTLEGAIIADFTNLGLANTLTANQIANKWSSVAYPPNKLENYGAAALTKLNPLDLSELDAVQSLVELFREGIPKLPIRKYLSRNQGNPYFQQLKKERERYLPGRKKLGDLGDETLNWQFGWMPILHDIRNIYQAYKQAEQLLSQIKRDNGKKVRRRATLVNTRSEVTSEAAAKWFYPSQSFFNGPGTKIPAKVRRSVVTTQRIWCVGRGGYYIPDVDSVDFHDKFMKNLYGAQPSLSVLYELMPWSWLLDWFTNVGDIIHYYLTPGVGTYVFDYAYLMRHNRVETRYFADTTSIDFWPGDGTNVFTLPASQAIEVSETKERIAASPYGFGLKLSDLSARQLAILAALGLSKQKFA